MTKYVLKSVFTVLIIYFSMSSASLFAESIQGLSGALQAVVQHHPAVAGKQAELEAQNYAIDTAQAERYPSLTFQANTTDSLDDEQLNVRLEQPVWTFGKLDTASDLAKSGYQGEQWDLLRVQRSLVEKTAVQYAQILGIREQLKISDTNIDELKLLYDSVKRRSKGGLAAEADVLLASARLEQGRLNSETLKGALSSSIIELQALTQIPVSTHELVPSQVTQLTEAKELEAEILQVNADIQLKQSRVEDAELMVKTQRLSWTPDVMIWAQHIEYDGSRYSDDTQVGIGLKVRLDGMGFVSRNKIREAMSTKIAAEQDVRVVSTEVRRLVNTLLVQWQTQVQQQKVQQLNVDALIQALASYQRQYNAGHKSWVDVLNTQRELTVSRLQLVKFKNNHLITSLRLVAMSGRLDALAGIQTP